MAARDRRWTRMAATGCDGSKGGGGRAEEAEAWRVAAVGAGVQVGSAAVGWPEPHGSRGLVATRDVAEGEWVLRVPKSLRLHSRHVRLRGIDRDRAPADMRLAAALLHARMRRRRALAGRPWSEAPGRGGGEGEGESGREREAALYAFWGEYVSRFHPPLEAFATPLATLVQGGGEEALGALQDAALVDEASIGLRRLQHPWSHGVDEVEGGKEALAHALTCVHSRCFGTGDDDGASFLVPFACMLNHAFNPNCSYPSCPPGEEDARSPWFDVVAKKDIPAGTELTISYGEKTSTELLDAYGFSLEGNPLDAFRGLRDEGILDRTRVMRFFGLQGGLPPASGPGSKALEDVYALGVPYAELPEDVGVRRRMAVARSLPKSGIRGVVSAAEERPRLVRMRHAVAHILDTFPSTLGEDEAILVAGRGGHRYLAHVGYRAERKRVLHLAGELLAAYADNIPPSS